MSVVFHADQNVLKIAISMLLVADVVSTDTFRPHYKVVCNFFLYRFRICGTLCKYRCLAVVFVERGLARPSRTFSAATRASCLGTLGHSQP